MNRAAALRVSLLVSLGLAPIACSGKTLSNGEEDEGGAGSGGAGGTGAVSAAGKPSKGGATPGTGGVVTGTGGVLIEMGGGTTGGGAGGRALCSPGKLDPVTQLVVCADQGYSTRPMAGLCNVPLSTGGAGGEGAVELPRASGSDCQDDADCSQFELGFCELEEPECLEGGAGQAGNCRSGCANDDDCRAGFLCVCGKSAHGGECVRGDCRTDSDCGPQSVCASIAELSGTAFHCTSPKDACTNDAGCDELSVCEFSPSQGHRECFEVGVCGRPFLVEQQVRVASAINRGDWSQRELSPRVAHLAQSEREALAAHWTKLGQMEHASIAAFARFQLQLLALGAPPELIRACNQALVDETAHTQLCFGLASAYAGRDLGPGPLDVSHSLDVSSLADIVDLVIAEGCFGETSAALEALEAADQASDPVIRNVYARIAEDEQRHAELAFHFVRWALQRGGEEVRERVELTLHHAPLGAGAVAVPCLRGLLGASPIAATVEQRYGVADRA